MNGLAGLAALLLLTASAPPTAVPQENAPIVTVSELFVAAPNERPRIVESENGTLTEAVAPESVVYFPIGNATRAKDLAGIRALVDDWQSGEDCVGAPRIEYRMMYDETGQEQLGYRYVVALPIRDVPDAREHPVCAKIAVGKRWAGSVRLPFSFTVKRGSRTVSADSVMCAPGSQVLKFGADVGQITLLFADLARFEVDAQGQGPLNAGYSAEALTDIAAQYPTARLRFLVWGKAPIFNRVGRLFLYAGEGEYLYELTPNGLESCDAVFSVEDEGFVIETRRLSGYVLSDRPLGDPTTPTPPDNPLTGAAESKIGEIS